MLGAVGSISDELAKRLGLSKEAFVAKVDAQKTAERLAARRNAEERAAAQHAAAAPRYPGARALSLAEARAVLADVPSPPPNPCVEWIFDPETFTLPSVQWVDGPLELSELVLPAEGGHLFVGGSLTVRGLLQQDFRAGHLLVLGDLRAGHIVTTGEIACTGALEVEGLLFGNCTNYATNVWGPARADVLVSAKEHAFCFGSGVQARLVVDVTGGAPNLERTTHDGCSMHEILHDDFGDGYDERRVAELVRRRGTVLR